MGIIANRLNQAMAEMGITARDLSKRSGVSESDISHYRKGDYMPKRDNIFRLATALGVSPVWLSGFDLSIETIDDLWRELTPESQVQARNYILYLISQQEK